MGNSSNSVDLTEPSKRRRGRLGGPVSSKPSDCIDLSLEDDEACGLLKDSLCMAAFGSTDAARSRQRKRAWGDMATAGAPSSDALFCMGSSGTIANAFPGGSSSFPSQAAPSSGSNLQWGATGVRQRRQRKPACAPRAAAAVDDDLEVSIVSIIPAAQAPAPLPPQQQQQQQQQPLSLGWEQPQKQQQPAPRRAAQQRRGAAPAQVAPLDARAWRQVQEDARLAKQLEQEEELRRRRAEEYAVAHQIEQEEEMQIRRRTAEDFARARMQMWQEMEESPSARSRSCQQQQQPPTRRSGVSRRHHGGGGPYMPPYGPPAFLPPGLPPHTLFGGGGGSASGGRHGHGHGHGFMPQSIMALREAVVGMQRTGLPPQLLFSDRDFTADDYDMLCRLDELVEKKGASATQLASLPTQTVPAGGLVGEGGEKLACSVCLEEFAEGQQLCMLPCLHKYHGTCIQTWLKQKATCPVCQQKL